METYCEVHKETRNYFLCLNKECMKAVCPFCVKKHKGHKLMDGIEVGQEIIKKLQTQEKDSTEEHKVLTNYEKLLTDMTRSILRKKQEAISSAERQEQEIMQQIANYKKMIMKDTNEKLENVKKAIRKCAKIQATLSCGGDLKKRIDEMKALMNEIKLGQIFENYIRMMKDSEKLRGL